jgi:nucleoside-diphosphate-sugar epimerase
LDIAATIVEEMELPFNGREIRYIASEEISPNEIANVLGKSIGNSDLKWKVMTDEELLNEMLGFWDEQANSQRICGYASCTRHRKHV